MKKMWQRCSNIEKALVMLSAVLFVASITFLVYFETLFNKRSVHPDDQIARVMSTNQQVRRRMPMSFEFDNLEEGDVIGSGDSIFSGDNSQIMLKFNKGSQLVIGEQSLVVLREVDGKMDMKIEKGGISGALAESEEIEIQAAEESVTINGEKDAQFSVSYKPGLGMEIISFDKNINVKYKGDEVQLKDKKAFVSDKEGMKTTKWSSNPSTGRESRDPTSTQSNDEEAPPGLPDGIDIENVKKAIELTLSAPFPASNQAFMHNHGGQIPIFPKQQCTQKCELKVYVNSKLAIVKKFEKNQLPIVHLKIEKNIEAKINWTFSDGEENSKGNFQILRYNEENFTKALKNQLPVEIIN